LSTRRLRAGRYLPEDLGGTALLGVAAVSSSLVWRPLSDRSTSEPSFLRLVEGVTVRSMLDQTAGEQPQVLALQGAR
jgi:hypothetical protein